jgi:hypothetical protein
MKKAAIAFILLVTVLGVSYLNAIRDKAREKDEYRQGFSQGAAETQVATDRADSLANLAATYRLSYRDSLTTAESLRAVERDSLTGLLSEKDQQIAQLQEKARSAAARQKSVRKESGSSNLKHSQILDYYKRKLAGLPKDLSQYERTVALAEIREETIQKFSITGAELEKIRQSGKITD